MNPSVALAKRNVLCYIRDRQSVLFSLMGVLIVVLLYLLFLRNMLIESYPDLPGMDNLVDVWVMSGILGIVPVTTCAGALQTMVEDRTGGRDRDMRGQNLILAKHDVWNFDCYKTICTVTYGQFKGFSRIILIILTFF